MCSVVTPAPPDASPKLQSYWTIPTSSEEPLPSKLHVEPSQEYVKLAAGVLSPMATSEYRSRFGEPVPVPVRRPVVALETMAPATSEGDAPGFCSRYRAPTPAT